jgi:hypothetical protein
MLLVALATAVVISLAGPASAQATTRCAELFPEASWIAVPGAGVDVGVSEVPDGQVPRFRDDVAFTASAVAADIGGLDGATVCIIGRESTFDGTRYVDPPLRFHAAVDGPRNVIVLSAENPGNIRPAAAFSIAQLALWNASDGEGWPEPLASTIAHWYRGLALDRMDQYRVESTGADFSVDALTGESSFGLDFTTDPRVDWTEGSQAPILVWDPENNESPTGYFIEYTVANEGTEVLADTDPAAWTERERLWRTALLVDLTGRTEPTTDWIAGLGIAIAAIAIAAAIAVGGFVTKRRKQRRRASPART